jgi:hypothetical protein
LEGGLGEGGGEEEQKLRTEKTWRESVVWYLGRALEAAGEVQRGMMERRLEREVERSRSVLYMSRGSGAALGLGANAGKEPGSATAASGTGKILTTSDGGPTPTSKSSAVNPIGPNHHSNKASASPSAFSSSADGSDAAGAEEINGLTASQLQLFAQENQAMLKQYEDTLDQVRFVYFPLYFITTSFPPTSCGIHIPNTYKPT